MDQRHPAKPENIMPLLTELRKITWVFSAIYISPLTGFSAVKSRTAIAPCGGNPNFLGERPYHGRIGRTEMRRSISRVIIVLAGIILGQLLMYGPALIGRKILL